jgi:excisionase family DNA binding protein
MKKDKIEYEILSKRIEYLSEKLNSLEGFLGFDPEDIQKRVSKVEAILFSSKDMLTSAEACYYLGISKSQLYKMTCTHTIPHYKPNGKQVYFCKKELDEWMKNNPVMTTQNTYTYGKKRH